MYDKHPGRLLGRRRTRTYKSCEILIVDDRRKYLSVIMNRIGKSRETGLETSFGYYQKRMNGDSTMSQIRSLLETKREISIYNITHRTYFPDKMPMFWLSDVLCHRVSPAFFRL